MALSKDKLSEERATCRQKMEALVDKATADKRGLTDAENTEFQQLNTRAQQLYEELVRLDAHPDSALVRAQQGAPQAAAQSGTGRSGFGDGIHLDNKKEREQVFSRLVMAVAFARHNGGGKLAALEYSQRMFGENYPLSRALEKDMRNSGYAFPRSMGEEERALAAGDGPSGGFAVADEWSQDIIEFLRPASTVIKFGGPTLPMTTGTLRLPRISGGATATYVGENVAAVKTQQVFGMVTANYKKLTALVPISNDLFRFASPNAESMIRGDLVAAMAQRADLAFIRDNGSASTPKGMRYWAPALSNVISAQTGQALSTTIQDLGKLVVQLRVNNVRFLNPGWIMAPRIWNYLLTITNTNGFYVFRDEMLSKGTLWGYPYQVTSQIPVNLTDVSSGTAGSELYFTDFADFVICQATQLLIDSSTEAAYVDGGNVQAAFSNDQTVIRAILEHDCVARHDFSIAVLTGMTWA